MYISEAIFDVEPEGDLQSYCIQINALIRRFALYHGKQGPSPGGTTHYYFDGVLKCTYFDSDYGNDRYQLDVVKEDRLVPVYALLDKPDKLFINLLFPGDWLEILQAVQAEYDL
ncbi:MAG: hypothetical protein IJK60_11145 [Clostridia bacterium]|nr:hypothetical protein [Clostridia bacterium]